MKGLFNAIIEGLYPNFCVLCDEVLEHGSGRGICQKCEEVHPYLEKELCSVCGKSLIDLSSDLCHDCQKQSHYFLKGRSMWTYEKNVKASIHGFKYHDNEENGQQFAKELIRYYNRIKKWPIDMVVPVPLHQKREKRRGYNQARIVAEIFAKAFKYNLADKGVLTRTINTQPQKELTDRQRIDNLHSAFSCDHEAVKGKNVLLIDDIYTTGSTMDACAKSMIEAAANEVYFLTIAIGRGL